MKKILLIILTILLSLNAQALFEIKDASDNSVFEISTDGMRVFNLGDTLMVISSSEIKAFIDESSKDRALSRSFSITTSTSAEKLVGTHVLDITTDATIMREGVGGDQYTNFSPDNIFIGLSSGINSTGANNVFVGNQAGLTNGTGFRNVFVGPEAGYTNAGGDENVFMGYQAGRSNSSGNRNVYIGCEAGELNTGGSQNICIGDAAGKNNTAVLSVFIGTSAGWKNTNGVSNMFIGNQAGAYNTTGSFNNYLGWYAGGACTGSHNTMLGTLAGYGVTAGDYNVYIGEGTGIYNDGGSGNVCLGSNVTVTGSNKLAIDNSDISTPLIYGDFSTNALTVNGTLNVTGNTTMNGTLTTGSNTSVGGNLTTSGVSTLNGTYFRISSDPGTAATPTNYVYQGNTGSVGKRYAFAINDALWVAKHVFIDGNTTMGSGGTAIVKVQSGTIIVGTHTGGVKTVTKTFTTAFADIPKINVTVKGDVATDVYAITTSSVTATSFKVNIYRVDSSGGGWGQNLKVDWFAWDQ